MGLIEIFLGFFGNIFNVVMLLVFLALGVILGLLLRPKWGNSVMKLLPKTARFVEFGIAEETAVSISCDDKKGFPPQRFIKISQGFVGTVGRFVKKSVTRYLAKEGTAYTFKTTQNHLEEIPGGIPAAIKQLWGQTEYDKIPPHLKDKLEQNLLAVTVDLQDGLTPEGYRPVTEEDIKREEDREAAKTWWMGRKMAEKGTWVQVVFILLAGVGIALILQIIGILRI